MILLRVMNYNYFISIMESKQQQQPVGNAEGDLFISDNDAIAAGLLNPSDPRKTISSTISFLRPIGQATPSSYQ
jgi:hypothetical protein